jgi:hypothetical protein
LIASKAKKGDSLGDFGQVHPKQGILASRPSLSESPPPDMPIDCIKSKTRLLWVIYGKKKT